jgi:predicted enzyme related to lactoylglutathione lyase
MLKDSPLAAVLPTTDLNKAKDFYANKLGLKLIPMPMEDPLIFEAGKGTTAVIYYRPDATKAKHTVAGFNVKDIKQTIHDLEAKGVMFEDYDTEDIHTINHIMDYGSARSAWFKDPDGNIIAINQM